MDLSIVIAVHNESDNLRQTITSCLNTCPPIAFEIIVADDASTDLDVSALIKEFPKVQVTSNSERLGPSPTKDCGARLACGRILVFLDAHCKPEPDAIARLLKGVDQSADQAIITPAIAPLETLSWTTKTRQAGHGYRMTLEHFDGQWIPLSEMTAVTLEGTLFYESPSMTGCAFALSRKLYERLGGFDPDMRLWGVEDLDLGLRCWLMGAKVLHDPRALVGHRFQKEFNAYTAPREQILANQLRMARKNFSDEVWQEWIERCQARLQSAELKETQNLWERGWALFQQHRESVEEERASLLRRRTQDEFWYAQQFRLDWPAAKPPMAKQASLKTATIAPEQFAAMFAPSTQPPTPPTGAQQQRTSGGGTTTVPATQMSILQRSYRAAWSPGYGVRSVSSGPSSFSGTSWSSLAASRSAVPNRTAQRSSTGRKSACICPTRSPNSAPSRQQAPSVPYFVPRPPRRPGAWRDVNPYLSLANSLAMEFISSVRDLSLRSFLNSLRMGRWYQGYGSYNIGLGFIDWLKQEYGGGSSNLLPNHPGLPGLINGSAQSAGGSAASHAGTCPRIEVEQTLPNDEADNDPTDDDCYGGGEYEHIGREDCEYEFQTRPSLDCYRCIREEENNGQKAYYFKLKSDPHGKTYCWSPASGEQITCS